MGLRANRCTDLIVSTRGLEPPTFPCPSHVPLPTRLQAARVFSCAPKSSRYVWFTSLGYETERTSVTHHMASWESLMMMRPAQRRVCYRCGVGGGGGVKQHRAWVTESLVLSEVKCVTASHSGGGGGVNLQISQKPLPA